MTFEVTTDIMKRVYEKVDKKDYRPYRVVRQKTDWYDSWKQEVELYFSRFEKVGTFPTLTPWFPGCTPPNENEKLLIMQFADISSYAKFIKHLMNTTPGAECPPNLDKNLEVCGNPIILTNIVERFLWRINGFLRVEENTCKTIVKQW